MENIFAKILSLVLCVVKPAAGMAQEAYAVESNGSSTLTFYFDKKKSSRQGKVYELNEGKDCG